MTTLNLPFVSDTGGLTGSGGTFTTVAGRTGLLLAALDFVSSPAPIDLSGNWSISAYLRATGPAQKTYLELTFAGAGRVLSRNLNTDAINWTKVFISQQVTSGVAALAITVDSAVIESAAVYPLDWGMPVGFVIYNDDPTAAVGNVQLSEVTLTTSNQQQAQLIAEVTYELAIITQPPPPISGSSVQYILNNKLFTTYGVVVSKSKGVLSVPDRKAPASFSFPLANGETVDLRRPRFEPRQMTLSCFIAGSNPADLRRKFTEFCAEVYRPGTSRLQINVFGYAPLVYEVYVVAGIDLEKVPGWRNGQMYATFELVFREPQPVKRVFAITGPVAAYLSFTNAEPVSIHWGDGTHDYDVFETGTLLTHTYAATGIYYIVIAGETESMTGLITNLTEL